MLPQTGADCDRVMVGNKFPYFAQPAQSQRAFLGDIGKRVGHYFGRFYGDRWLNRFGTADFHHPASRAHGALGGQAGGSGHPGRSG